MATDCRSTKRRRVAIVGGGISGLGAAWALHHHPDQFDFRLFEGQAQIGGNAITADMPQDDGSTIPFRHFRHRLYSVGISPHPVVDGKVRH